MPTPTMSDEELDALFRRGAEAYPNDIPAGAWASLETTLDEAARTQQLRTKVTRYFAGELMLVAAIIWQAVRLALPDPAAVGGSQAATKQPAPAGRAAVTTLVGPRPAASPSRNAANPGGLPATATQATEGTPALAALAKQSTVFAAPTGPGGPAAGSATMAPSRASGSFTRTVIGRSSLHTEALLHTLASSKVANSQVKSAKSPADKQQTLHLSMAVATRFNRRRGGEQAEVHSLSAGLQTTADTPGGYVGPGLAGAEKDNENAFNQPFTSIQSIGAEGRESVELLAGRVATLPVMHYPLPDYLRQVATQQAPAAGAAWPNRPALAGWLPGANSWVVGSALPAEWQRAQPTALPILFLQPLY
ncbi:MAG: hypothetical protein EOO62_23215, partial [Hymenobacter sp.]